MRTAVVSDLHLGIRGGCDVVRRPDARDALLAALAGVDQLVLLGDCLELRGNSVDRVLESAEPFLGALGEAMSGRRVVIVAGNHDHELAAPLLERRRLGTARPSRSLADEAKPGRSGIAAQVARRIAGAEVVLSYPGVWLRTDVYATHGHYLDCHNTVPSFEALAAAVMRRLTRGRPAVGPEVDGAQTPDDYEAALAPLYAFLYNLAQSTTPARDLPGAGASVRIWELVNAQDGSRRLAGRALGAALVPGAVAVANRAGLGPFKPDLSGAELRRAALRGMGEVVSRLRIDADHVLFGHTHRAGPFEDDLDHEWRLPGGGRLTNTGSWLHEPAFIGDAGARSPHWPGTCAIVDDAGPPRLVRLLGESEAAPG